MRSNFLVSQCRSGSARACERDSEIATAVCGKSETNLLSRRIECTNCLLQTLACLDPCARGNQKVRTQEGTRVCASEQLDSWRQRSTEETSLWNSHARRTRKHEAGDAVLGSQDSITRGVKKWQLADTQLTQWVPVLELREECYYSAPTVGRTRKHTCWHSGHGLVTHTSQKRRGARQMALPCCDI